MKTLKLYNGNINRKRHGYIAAHSKAEAIRVALAGGYQLAARELSNYWSECWGTQAERALGMPTEPCFWVYSDEKRQFERLDKEEPVVPRDGRRGLGVKYTKFDDIPHFTRDGSWECDFPMKRVWHNIEEFQRTQGLDIDPDFQRAHVWTESQQVAWIEFFLRGGKTSRVIYLNKPSWHNSAKTGYDDFVLVDGKQRLEAIRRFIYNEIRAFGSYYREFTDSLRITQTIKFNINDLQTRREVLQWYLDFNSGGVVHSAEEINRVRDLLAAA